MRDKRNIPRKFLKLNYPDKKRRTNKEISARRDSRLKFSAYIETQDVCTCAPIASNQLKKQTAKEPQCSGYLQNTYYRLTTKTPLDTQRAQTQ